ncbi:FecR family protein [Mucilaginibacter boryungensis]|uniref:FecR domain-containing protein n=1 Tax=Mucilaginibacter boryungensis TaxID=768480 RepID=A0ABR9XLC8_9SPHI|nr:FecR family protein [Mucilaginibacter boryungensis]MBE9668021.1 FecR domain-containing protein [Mucilaginibacter boryungensis]
MDNADFRVTYLLKLYLRKQASHEEIAELLDLLELSSVEEISGVLEEYWEQLDISASFFETPKSEEIYKRIIQQKNKPAGFKPGFLMAWFSIAASILFIAGGAYYLVSRHAPVATAVQAKVVLAHDALPGSEKAILTLGNGETIDLDSASKGMVTLRGNIQIVKKDDGQINYQPANTALQKQKIEINTVTTPRGGTYHIVLPDGSNVWLNAASQIKFPTAFIGPQRRIELNGEAYFEVAKNPAMPFIVKVNAEEVKVLGTHFNIMAYDDEQSLRTTLLEGAVMLTTRNISYTLHPGNQAVLAKDGNLKMIENADIGASIAWKEGLFQFKDENIANILRQAARWYNLDVSYQGKVPLKQFTGKISRNIKLSEMLSMFKYAGINFDIEGNHITVLEPDNHKNNY